MLNFVISGWEGGVSFSKYRGITNSSALLTNINIRTTPEAISLNQALKLDSGTIITDKPIRILQAGNDIYAFGDTGNIYKKTSGTWSKVYTGGTPIYDGAYFYEKIYWTTATKLYRCAITSANWATDKEEVSVDNDLENTTYHSMYSVGDHLFICNGRYVATVKVSTEVAVFQKNSLDFNKDWGVRSLNLLKPLLIIGATSSGRSKTFTWDFINSAESWEEVAGLEEGTITEFKEAGGSLIAAIGSKLFYYNGLGSLPIFDFGKDINFASLTFYNGILNLSTSEGIWSFGRKDKNLPQVPVLEYVCSGATALLGTTSQLYVGVQDGVKVIDTTLKATTGTIETLVISEKKKYIFRGVEYYFDKLPASTSIQLYYKNEIDTTWKAFKNASGTAQVANTTNQTFDKVQANEQVKELQIKIVLTGHLNTSPTLRSVKILFD